MEHETGIPLALLADDLVGGRVRYAKRHEALQDTQLSGQSSGVVTHRVRSGFTLVSLGK